MHIATRCILCWFGGLIGGMAILSGDYNLGMVLPLVAVSFLVTGLGLWDLKSGD